MDILGDIIHQLQNAIPLKDKYRDHMLVGEWNGDRECHITPDWLLIYKIDTELELLRHIRTGSHSDLFQ